MEIVATALLPGSQLAERLNAAVPEAVTEVEDGCAYVQADRLLESARFLHDDTELDGRYLIAISGVDRYDRFEVVYHIASLSHNHQFVLKVRADHDNPEVPSVASVWLGAHLQEREAFDLLGIRFSGHSDLKRLFLWEGFPGHPLRKDYMSLPGGFSPGLRRFPKEKTDEWGGEFRAD
ncbi:MAG: NADH-quinone oxidoreductase subunit C [Chloroflexi bacterium]|nr:NADH-quinone oxidoreductase subunit C [Chloroflexota bacterium]